MSKNDDRGERLGSLELVPRDGANKPATGKAVFHANTRTKGSERRVKDADRRDESAFAKIYDSMVKFRDEQLLWFRVAEKGFDDFMHGIGNIK